MIKKIWTWIFGEKTAEAQPAAAPYKVETPEVVVPVADATIPVVVPEAVTTAVLEVKAKFKKADLAKKTKKELLDLAAEQGLTVKARATKEELIKVLLKS